MIIDYDIETKFKVGDRVRHKFAHPSNPSTGTIEKVILEINYGYLRVLYNIKLENILITDYDDYGSRLERV